jgi:hypothetical protein
MNGGVYALTIYNGLLIAGGEFTTAGGISASRIAAWDGSNWSPLGSGMNGYVEALAVYDGLLIAAGNFTTADGLSANHIAAWDGSNWSPLGSGINNWVHALTVYDGRLIAGGYFNNAGGTSVNSIASWDGSSWSSIGSSAGLVEIFDLTAYDSQLIAGGASNIGASNIAAWDGSSWSSLGSGMEGCDPYCSEVLALVVFHDLLIAAGRFAVADGLEANNIAAWDGSTWSALGAGIQHQVDLLPRVCALIVHEDLLIAGGWFAMAGGTSANCVAAWDGSFWSALGTGTDNGVFAFSNHDGRLIAGGGFTQAGDSSAKYIASWTGDSVNQPPIAMIDYIEPNPGIEGEEIAFSGHGTDADGTVVGYMWTSSIDGDLSTKTSFNLSTLSVGDHTISFRVQDNSGAWSSDELSVLTVNPPCHEEIIDVARTPGGPPYVFDFGPPLTVNMRTMVTWSFSAMEKGWHLVSDEGLFDLPIPSGSGSVSYLFSTTGPHSYSIYLDQAEVAGSSVFVQAPDLSISSSMFVNVQAHDPDDPLHVGDEVEYRFTLSNNGDGIASNIELAFPIADFVDFVTGSILGDGQYDQESRSVTCTTPLLDAGETETYGFKITVPPQPPVETDEDYPILSVAGMGTYCESNDPLEHTLTSSVGLPIPDFYGIPPDENAQYRPGDEVSYFCVLRNMTYNTATNFVALINLDPNTELLGLDGIEFLYNESENTLTVHLDEIGFTQTPGTEAIVFALRVRIKPSSPDGATIMHHAELACDQLVGIVSRQTDPVTVGRSKLEIRDVSIQNKVNPEAPVNNGDLAVVRITLVNNGTCRLLLDEVVLIEASAVDACGDGPFDSYWCTYSEIVNQGQGDPFVVRDRGGPWSVPSLDIPVNGEYVLSYDMRFYQPDYEEYLWIDVSTKNGVPLSDLTGPHLSKDIAITIERDPDWQVACAIELVGLLCPNIKVPPGTAEYAEYAISTAATSWQLLSDWSDFIESVRTGNSSDMLQSVSSIEFTLVSEFISISEVLLGTAAAEVIGKVFGVWGAVYQEITEHTCSDALVYLGNDFVRMFGEEISRRFSYLLGTVILNPFATISAKCPIEIRVTDPSTGEVSSVSSSSGVNCQIDSTYGLILGDAKFLYAPSLSQYKIEIIGEDTGHVDLHLLIPSTESSQMVAYYPLVAVKSGSVLLREPTGDPYAELQIDFDGDGYAESSVVPDSVIEQDIPTDVSSDPQGQSSMPTEYSLSANYPNPFNPTTVIEFNLPKRSHVSISVYNILGQEVAKLVDEDRSAGSYTITWDGIGTAGHAVATGIYLYRMQAGEYTETKKMILLK